MIHIDIPVDFSPCKVCVHECVRERVCVYECVRESVCERVCVCMSA